MQSHGVFKIRAEARNRLRQIPNTLLKLRSAVHQCQELVFIIDSAGQFEYVNPAFERLTGYSSREARGRDLSLIAGPYPASGSCRSTIEQALDHGFYRGTLEAHRKDASTFELDLVMTAVQDLKTGSMSLVCTGRDRIQEPELQAELSHARKIGVAGTLASGVAHDFNNLLMVITAYAELGLNALESEHPLRHNLQEILTAARRASDLVQQLLVFGRRQVDGVQLFSMNSVIEACRMLPQVMGEDIELYICLGKSPDLVHADPGQIEQVLLNLALNARDAMPEGGQLLIETRTVHLPDDGNQGPPGISAGDYVLLAVSDSGQGIPPEQLSRIFQAFYTTKAKGKGTGLGLSMVDSIVKQNGGFIQVDSSPGVGSTFNLYFPLVGRSGEDEPGPAPAESPTVNGSETLLVVEDDDAVRSSTVAFLSSLGYVVLSASNGREALQKSRAHPSDIDVLITDVVMPQMSGPKLREILASERPPMRVLFVSGHSQGVLQQKGVENFDTQFLQKPFPLRLLASRIRSTIDEGAPELATAAAMPDNLPALV